MMTNLCKRLTIFEGPDGSGKSTAAKAYAAATNAVYVHFGPLPNVSDGLARLYVEAMLPALLGYQDVVFDRSWLSEVPYGEAFRGGADRLGPDSRRMLERLAMRCATVVVRCLPPVETCVANFSAHKGEEYLQAEEQLRQVYQCYEDRFDTELPWEDFDYTCQDIIHLSAACTGDRTKPHLVNIHSAGNARAKVMLVGEKFAERKNQDPWYQWPFASFSGLGGSQWLTAELRHAGIREDRLFWVSADELTGDLFVPGGGFKIVALGAAASDKLRSLGATEYSTVAHPQAHKRFFSNMPYPLIDLLKGAWPC